MPRIPRWFGGLLCLLCGSAGCDADSARDFFSNDGGVADAATASDASDAGGLSDGGDCDAGAQTSCACVPGSKVCVEGDVTAEFVCVEADGGPTLERHPCPALSWCADGACSPCPTPADCTLGELSCSADGATLQLCGCLGLEMAVDCGSQGMACLMPDPTQPVTSKEEYCVNECGVRGKPLEYKLCSPVPNAPCGYLVCDPSTQELVSDHTACLPAGGDCKLDTDCIGCACVDGGCIGNTKKSCNPLCQ